MNIRSLFGSLPRPSPTINSAGVLSKLNAGVQARPQLPQLAQTDDAATPASLQSLLAQLFGGMK